MKRLELSLRLKNSDLNAARLPIPPHPHLIRQGGGYVAALWRDEKGDSAWFDPCGRERLHFGSARAICDVKDKERADESRAMAASSGACALP